MPADFHTDLVFRFNDRDDDDDVCHIMFMNLKGFDYIGTPESKHYMREQLFRKWICRSGHHDDDPWDC